MEHNPARGCRVKPENGDQMPGNCLPLTVLIGSNPYRCCLVSKLAKLGNNLLFIFRYFIDRSKIVVNLNTQFVSYEVTDMPEARHNGVILSEKFFYRLCFGRRFNYYQIISHSNIFKNRAK